MGGKLTTNVKERSFHFHFLAGRFAQLRLNSAFRDKGVFSSSERRTPAHVVSIAIILNDPWD